MYFIGNDSIPSNTISNDPYTYTIGLSKGTIKRIEVFFPFGCAGLVGIQVIRYTWQLFPQSRGKWIIGDNVLFFDEPFEVLETEPYEIIVKAYNLDDTYNHTPLIGVEVVKTTETQALTKFLQAIGLK